MSKRQCRGFDPVCTKDEARAYFKNKGLTYPTRAIAEIESAYRWNAQREATP